MSSALIGPVRYQDTDKKRTVASPSPYRSSFEDSFVPLALTVYITFSSSQELVIVPEVRDKLRDAWGIDAGVRIGEFSSERSAYLDYHRANVFKRALLDS